MVTLHNRIRRRTATGQFPPLLLRGLRSAVEWIADTGGVHEFKNQRAILITPCGLPSSGAFPETLGVICIETVAKIRRRLLVHGESVSGIARELELSSTFSLRRGLGPSGAVAHRISGCRGCWVDSARCSARSGIVPARAGRGAYPVRVLRPMESRDSPRQCFRAIRTRTSSRRP
jgi:hypothetical protein